MNRSISILIIVGMFFGVVLAQDISTTTGGNDWVVKVTLKNGSEIKGVVLADCFIEKARYGRIYAETESTTDPGAGVRVWYVRNSPGFVFLPYEEVKMVVRLGKLNAESRRMIEDRIRIKAVQTLQKTLEERREREERLKKEGVGLSEEEAREMLEKEAKELEKKAKEKLPQEEILKKLPPELAELVRQFPPENGWGEEIFKKVKAQINRAATKFVKKVINGQTVIQRAPARGGASAEEEKFVDNYDNWVRAIDLFKQEEEKALKQMKEELAQKTEEEKTEPGKESLPSVKSKESTDVEKPAVTMPEKKETEEEMVDAKDIVSKALDRIYYGKAKERLQAMSELAAVGSKASSAVKALKLYLKDESPEIRRTAIQTIVKIGEPLDEVLVALGDTLEQGDVMMRREAAMAFVSIGPNGIKKFQTLALAVGDEDAKVRYFVVRALESIGKKDAVAYIKDRMWDADLAVQVAACHALLQLMPEESVNLDRFVREPLMKGLKHSEESICFMAVDAIQKLAQNMKKEKMNDPAEISPKLVSLKQEVEQALSGAQEKIKTQLQQIWEIVKDERIEESAEEKSTEEEPEEEE